MSVAHLAHRVIFIINRWMLPYLHLYIEIFVHDDAIKWKHFLHDWPFVRGIHRSPVDSPHKGQWRGALMVYLICTWTNGRANKRDASDLRCHRAHYDVTVINCFVVDSVTISCMKQDISPKIIWILHVFIKIMTSSFITSQVQLPLPWYLTRDSIGMSI